MADQHVLQDLQRIPVARVLFPFATGILLGNLISFPVPAGILFMISLVGWLCLLSAFRLFKSRNRTYSFLFAFLTFVLCLFLGAAHGIKSQAKDPKLPIEDRVVIRGMVKEAPRNLNSMLRCELSLQLLYAYDTVYRCNTQLHAYFYPDSVSELPRPGEVWQWLGTLKPVRNSGNPGSPDFEAIMQKKNSWYRFYASSLELPRHSARKKEVSFSQSHASYLRAAYFDCWQAGEEELALLKAVCLGDRSSLTEDMQKNYSSAGGMHLLAVSGLHVGLIWWVLQVASRWMVRTTRTELLRTFLVLSLLWFYASVTGFSSSVCRSVTMFSFVSAGRISGQRTQIINVILASALLLLVIQPNRVMELGFQLSYAAILGIVVFYPVFQRLFRIKNSILRWLWNAASVSLAAQLLTAPLVIYHFHYFPVYSILSSILAIPLLSLLIALFTISVPFITSGILEDIFFRILSKLAWLMNFSMQAISSLPGALMEGLHLSLLMLIIWMLILGLLMVFILSRSRLALYLMALLCSFMLCFHASSLVKLRQTSELVLCHFRGGSQAILREGRHVDIYSWGSDSISQVYMQKYSSEVWNRSMYITNYRQTVSGQSIKGSVSVCRELARGIWLVGNDSFSFWVLRGPFPDKRRATMLLDSGELNYLRPCIILLSGEPADFRPGSYAFSSSTELIMDGSNRTWFRERMHRIYEGIYDTERQGAYWKRW